VWQDRYKSIFSLAAAVELAGGGRRVVLADMDLGAANLHTYLGIIGKTPGVADFMLRRENFLADILVETQVKGLSLISGAEFLPGMANPPTG
jgi:flagellar biosynthesis protein FlhG